MYNDDPGSDTWPHDDIVASLKRSNTKLCVEAYETHFRLNKTLFRTPSSPLPVPQVIRVIPLVMAIWNVIKPGSDTISKMVARNLLQLPTKSPQVKAIVRTLLIVHCGAVHRLYQMAGADADLEKIHAIKVFRDNANHRYSSHESLLKTRKFCHEKKQSLRQRW